MPITYHLQRAKQSIYSGISSSVCALKFSKSVTVTPPPHSNPTSAIGGHLGNPLMGKQYYQFKRTDVGEFFQVLLKEDKL